MSMFSIDAHLRQPPPERVGVQRVLVRVLGERDLQLRRRHRRHPPGLRLHARDLGVAVVDQPPRALVDVEKRRLPGAGQPLVPLRHVSLMKTACPRASRASRLDVRARPRFERSRSARRPTGSAAARVRPLRRALHRRISPRVGTARSRVVRDAPHRAHLRADVAVDAVPSGRCWCFAVVLVEVDGSCPSGTRAGTTSS